VDLASEYRDLVAQHDDFDREIGVRAAGEPDQLEDANERPVQEREGHPRMLARAGTFRQRPVQGLRIVFSAPTTYVPTTTPTMNDGRSPVGPALHG